MHSESVTTVPEDDSGAAAMLVGGATAVNFQRPMVSDVAAERAIALYRAIFVNSPEAIAIVGADGRYLEQNAAHEQLIGYSDAELRDKTPAIHLGENEFQSIVRELLATGVSRRECASRTKSGAVRLIALSSFVARDASGEPVCYVGIKRDISEERRAAAELHQKFEELQAIYRMAEAVTRAGALEEIYAVALDELQRTVHADRASVLLYDDEEVMRFKAWRGLSDEYRRAVEGHSPWSPSDPDPQPVLVPDVGADAHFAELLPVFRQEGIGAVGFIPLVAAGRLLGKFMIYFDAPRGVAPSELRLAQAIASHIAFAITRKRDEAAMRESEQAQRLLAEAGTLLNSSLDYQETMRSITRLLVPAIADWCLVDLADERGGITRIAAAPGDANEALVSEMQGTFDPFPTGRGLPRSSLAGESELCAAVDDGLLVSAARDDAHLAMLRAMRMTSYISAPLMTRGRTIGALTIAMASSGRRYSKADLPLIEELARRAALAVDNARLYHEAQAANHAKSQFLATMSHELRTPLNAIGGYTELLQMELRGPLTAGQREDLMRIQRSQRHLLGLINDLLSFARIETGHLELNVEPVILEDILLGVEALLEPQIAAKALVYARDMGSATVSCLADPDKIQQVLANLLSNAVKFTPAGGTVSVDWDATPEQVRVRVRDTGPGIPADKLEAIFEPFVQLGASLTRVTEGAGLGLAISRELSRAMGGDVTVESEFGRGSTFTVTLPRPAYVHPG
ncbi:MAG TPA: ATP-binding protein [Gemmatimonadaceae bacterium]|nr:ATP-binding protein [Gemmatimonadaceae bacterium]